MDISNIFNTGLIETGDNNLSPELTPGELIQDAIVLQKFCEENVATEDHEMCANVLFSVLHKRLRVLEDGTGCVLQNDAQQQLGRMIIEFFNSIG